MIELPRTLSDLKPTAGLIKSDYEDFTVEEVPLYPADDAGTHTYFLLEKRGLSTMHAVGDLARALNVSRRAIGYAGLKDARAVTRQWMSIEHVDPALVQSLQIPRLRVLSVTRHHNKLRLGHLKGNRFVIRVRGTQTERLAEFQDALGRLVRVGVPNYFGHQRFGGRGDAWEVGRAVVRDDLEQALDVVLGRPSQYDRGDIHAARGLYEKGLYADAGRRWPVMFRDERRALKTMASTRGKKRRAFRAIDKTLRRFYVSAFQSHLFNQIVAKRLQHGLQRLWDGDLAVLHVSGAVFSVIDAEIEQPRADAFEISPSGPLFGYRMTEPEGDPGRMEAEVLCAEDLEPATFRSATLRVKGARRSLRFLPAEAKISLGADDRGAYLEFRFELPRGCYATALLREFFLDTSLAGPGPPGTESGDR